jgi:hypothetical protein
MPETQYTAAARPFGPQRGPRIVAAVLIVFVAVAVIKPWPEPSSDRSSADGRSSPAAASSGAPASPSPVPPPPPGPNTMSCLAGDQAQVVTVERAAGREVRSWIAASDEQQAEPLGLRQAPISIYSGHVVGIGICGPDRTAEAPTPKAPDESQPAAASQRTPASPAPTPVRAALAATIVDVVWLGVPGEATGPESVGLGSILPGQTAGVDTARLYGPPLNRPVPRPSATPPGPARSPASSAVRDPAAWPAGSWAIGFRYAADPPDVVRWVLVDILPVALGSS